MRNKLKIATLCVVATLRFIWGPSASFFPPFKPSKWDGKAQSAYRWSLKCQLPPPCSAGSILALSIEMLWLRNQNLSRYHKRGKFMHRFQWKTVRVAIRLQKYKIMFFHHFSQLHIWRKINSAYRLHSVVFPPNPYLRKFLVETSELGDKFILVLQTSTSGKFYQKKMRKNSVFDHGWKIEGCVKILYIFMVESFSIRWSSPCGDIWWIYRQTRGISSSIFDEIASPSLWNYIKMCYINFISIVMQRYCFCKDITELIVLRNQEGDFSTSDNSKLY